MVTPKRCWLEYQERSGSHLKQSTLSRQKRASEGGAPQIPTCLVKAWRGEMEHIKEQSPYARALCVSLLAKLCFSDDERPHRWSHRPL
jgi:hypothetical protein